jgi:serine/threonine protein kinase
MSDVDLAKKAIDEAGFERFVVIKRVKADRLADESFIRMFKDEARITSQLNHNNIAQTYDFGRVGDEYFLVLEYVPGFDIRGVINVLRDRDQRIPLRVVLFIMHEVLSGLEYAHTMIDVRGHSMNIVHRDVNPRNIMMSVRGEVKLIDFGVAKAADRLERTRTDHVKGKFRYMSPEQITGKPIDHRADLFALGLTFHEMLAGYSPYVGLSQIQIMHKLVSGEVPALPVVQELRDTTVLKRIHDKALNADLAGRYRDAAEFREDIVVLADTTGGLPKANQIAKFLQHVDAEFEGRIKEKLDNFSGPIELVSTDERDASVSDLRPSLNLSDDLSATLKALEVATTESQSRMGIIGSMLLGTMVTVSTIFLLLAGIAYYVANFTDFRFPGVTTVQPVGPAAAVPVKSAEPASAVPDAPGPVPDAPGPVPDAPGPVPEPATLQPAPAAPVPLAPPAPVVDQPPTVAEPARGKEATPVPGSTSSSENAERVGRHETPAPIVSLGELGSEPVPPLVFGMLQVTSAEKGRKIWIDGAITEFVTPARLEWPAGTVDIRVEGYMSQSIDVRESQVNNVIFR